MEAALLVVNLCGSTCRDVRLGPALSWSSTVIHDVRLRPALSWSSTVIQQGVRCRSAFTPLLQGPGAESGGSEAVPGEPEAQDGRHGGSGRRADGETQRPGNRESARSNPRVALQTGCACGCSMLASADVVGHCKQHAKLRPKLSQATLAARYDLLQKLLAVTRAQPLAPAVRPAAPRPQAQVQCCPQLRLPQICHHVWRWTQTHSSGLRPSMPLSQRHLIYVSAQAHRKPVSVPSLCNALTKTVITGLMGLDCNAGGVFELGGQPVSRAAAPRAERAAGPSRRSPGWPHHHRVPSHRSPDYPAGELSAVQTSRT